MPYTLCSMPYALALFLSVCCLLFAFHCRCRFVVLFPVLLYFPHVLCALYAICPMFSALCYCMLLFFVAARCFSGVLFVCSFLSFAFICQCFVTYMLYALCSVLYGLCSFSVMLLCVAVMLFAVHLCLFVPFNFIVCPCIPPLCSVPHMLYALCSVLYALCSMPALCIMPYALCSMPHMLWAYARCNVFCAPWSLLNKKTNIK